MKKMKKVTRTIATLVLTLTFLTYTAVADCGDMTNGSRCLVDSNPTTTTQVDKKPAFDFEKEVSGFFRNVWKGIFG